MYKFPRKHRIIRPADFQRVYETRVSAANQFIVLYVCKNGLEYSRLGISVSKRIGKAVIRNRWKRLIREAFRLSYSNLPAGLDLIVIPRATTWPAFEKLLISLPELTTKAAKKLAKMG